MIDGGLDILAAQAKTGDRKALEGLVRGLQPRLYQMALRFLGQPAHAEDATQEISILVITQLGGFRGESAITTWAYRIATRHLLRQRERWRRISFEALASEDLGKAPNAVEPQALASADERLLEEEVFVGCTQTMLQALDRPLRMAFVLGAILELDGKEAAAALDVSEPTFRKRLSRARAIMDGFVARHCGVADPSNGCRCVHQINHNVQRGRLDPARLRFAHPRAHTSVEALRALGEIHAVRDSLELYRAQHADGPQLDLPAQLRELLASAPTLSGSKQLPVTR